MCPGGRVGYLDDGVWGMGYGGTLTATEYNYAQSNVFQQLRKCLSFLHSLAFEIDEQPSIHFFCEYLIA